MLSITKILIVLLICYTLSKVLKASDEEYYLDFGKIKNNHEDENDNQIEDENLNLNNNINENEYENENENDCWDYNSTSCYIQYLINSKQQYQLNILKKGRINCHQPEILNSFSNYETYLNVTLNGCNTHFNINTFGLEYLQFCNIIESLTIEKFQKDFLQIAECHHNHHHHHQSSSLALKYLTLQYNNIGTIDSKSFSSSSLKQITDIQFFNNAIMFVAPSAFDELLSLESLHIEKDQLLNLESSDLIKNSNIKFLNLIDIKRLNPELFLNLPRTLEHLYILHVGLENLQIAFENPLKISNVTFKNCQIESLLLNDHFGTIKYLNLPGNHLRNFEITENNILESLDLSLNDLEYWPKDFPQKLPNLHYLNLNGNKIKILSVEKILSISANLELIDVRHNELVALKDIPQENNHLNVRLQIDSNPLNCKWLLDFGDTYPSMFRFLKYEKFISKINVNGLECQMTKEDIHVELLHNIQNVHHQQPSTFKTYSLDDINNYIKREENKELKKINLESYMSSIDAAHFKRNQRFEALIIIFLLPLGISILFLMLYLWLHCHDIFSFSFYTCFQRNTTSDTDNKNDGKQEPPSPDGYEVPLNCNSSEKYNKSGSTQVIQEVSYEILPTETPYKLYEEIPDIKPISNPKK